MTTTKIPEMRLARYRRAPHEHTYIGIGYPRALELAGEIFAAARVTQATVFAEAHLREVVQIISVMAPRPLAAPVIDEPKFTSYPEASRRALEICQQADFSTPERALYWYGKLKCAVDDMSAMYVREPQQRRPLPLRSDGHPYANVRREADEENERRSRLT